MKKLICWLSICLILCCIIGANPVSSYAADAATDELSDLFRKFYASGMEEGAEGRTYLMGEYFFEDPAEFVRRLSLETEDIQEKVIHNFPRSMYNEMHPRGYSEFPTEVFAISLTDEDTMETRNIVKALEKEIEKYWGLSNPQTGDPIGIAVLLMAFSGLGGAFLWKKRKISA